MGRSKKFFFPNYVVQDPNISAEGTDENQANPQAGTSPSTENPPTQPEVTANSTTESQGETPSSTENISPAEATADKTTDSPEVTSSSTENPPTQPEKDNNADLCSEFFEHQFPPLLSPENGKSHMQSVKLLQKFLIKKYDYKNQIDFNAQYDEKTIEAVKDFQTTHNLDNDGKVGPQTLESLKDNSNCS